MGHRRSTGIVPDLQIGPQESCVWFRRCCRAGIPAKCKEIWAGIGLLSINLSFPYTFDIAVLAFSITLLKAVEGIKRTPNEMSEGLGLMLESCAVEPFF